MLEWPAATYIQDVLLSSFCDVRATRVTKPLAPVAGTLAAGPHSGWCEICLQDPG